MERTLTDLLLIAEEAHLSLASSVVQSPGRNGEVEAIHNAGDEDGLQVPGVGGRAGYHTVLGQGNHGSIIEDSQQHNQQSWEVPGHHQLAYVSDM